MEVKVVTDVVTEPVTLAVMSNYLKWDDTVAAENTLIEDMIIAARVRLEKETNKAFAEKTIQVFINHNDLNKENSYDLPYAPHASITSVHSIDHEGTQTELTLNNGYFKRGLNEYSLIFPGITGSVGLFTTNLDFKIIYVAGYGTSGEETIPGVLTQAMQRLVTYWYDNREAHAIGEFPAEVWNLIRGFTKNVWI